MTDAQNSDAPGGDARAGDEQAGDERAGDEQANDARMPSQATRRRVGIVAAVAAGVVSLSAVGLGALAGSSGGPQWLGVRNQSSDSGGSGQGERGGQGAGGPAGQDAQGASEPGAEGTGGPGAGGGERPGPPPAGLGLPSDAELAAARADVAKLSTRALAGQVIVAQYPGTRAAEVSYLMRDIGLGGVIVMGDNVPSPPSSRVKSLEAASSAARTAMSRTGRHWPPLVAVDQEGGIVTRVHAPLTQFPAPMALGATGSEDLARRVALASGRELRSLGFTMVFAPTADVTDGTDAVIGTRALGSDPGEVGRLATAMVRGYSDAGLVPVVKHFPGHGRLGTDSHADRPTLAGAIEELEGDLGGGDLAPFRAAIEAGAPAVMAGHIVTSGIDPEAPASLSFTLLTEVLRDRYGFRGVVVTDSLGMGAITRYVSARDVGARAVAAGADVVLMPTDPIAARDGIVAAVNAGTLSRERLEDASARMVAALRAGARNDATYRDSSRATSSPSATAPVTSSPSSRPPGATSTTSPGATSTTSPSGAGSPAGAVGDEPGANQPVADELAGASIVQVGGQCGVRLVKGAIAVRGGTAEDRSALGSAARRAGLRVVAGSGADVTSVALVGGLGWYAGTVNAAQARSVRAEVVVATDNPAYLGMARASVAKLATFGRTPATWDALAAVLVGERPARGKLPVPIPGADRGATCRS